MRTFLASVPGYVVTHTQDGAHAVELLRDRQWDLLITDLNLPATDGFAVIRAAREHQRNIGILAVTAYVQEHYWDQAFRAGADLGTV